MRFLFFAVFVIFPTLSWADEIRLADCAIQRNIKTRLESQLRGKQLHYSWNHACPQRAYKACHELGGSMASTLDSRGQSLDQCQFKQLNCGIGALRLCRMTYESTRR